jgi:hypothetical protein
MPGWGGSESSRSMARKMNSYKKYVHGQVDRYHLVVHPVVSAGQSWFAGIEEKRELDLQSAAAYSTGVVGLYHVPRDA